MTLFMPTAIDNIILMIIGTKSNREQRLNVKETGPTWSQILFFPVTQALCEVLSVI